VLRHAPQDVPEVSLDPRGTADTPAVKESLIDAAVYPESRRVGSPRPSPPTRTHSAARAAGAVAWIRLYRPSDAQLSCGLRRRQFGVYELAMEDAIVAHRQVQTGTLRPDLFEVLRAARDLDEVDASSWEALAQRTRSSRHGIQVT